MTVVLPGGTIGILGGGQLGRMTALAARSLGYRVHVLDPDPDCAARAVSDLVITASFSDAAAAAELARGCDVVTVEIEKIAPASMDTASGHAPTRPSRAVLEIVQHRARQKDWLAAHEFPVAPYRVAASEIELARALAEFPGVRFVKSSTGGYDGRGQVRVEGEADVAAVWRDVGSAHCVVELGVDLREEISVMVARRPSGESAVFPVALNHHENQVLDWSVIPAPIPVEVAARATALGRAIADAIGIEGLLAIELFWLRDGRLLVNELAPRPHNTFHHTEAACLTSQFEQLVRAVCDLPLGATEVVRPAALINLFGDLWLDDAPPAFDAALAIPGVRCFLYGKVPRPGRKVGHLSATAPSTDEAVANAHEARRRLTTRR
ncbi:MAG: 5-(carboxyamino)imidazole ribonucleotide synthase [Gemmatimonadota bacterium]|nr:5-(carboxyamino)imidazole ribonucleotide synthase [Gemmatimonadota bacterium]